jgi:hypothetical protein
LTDDELRRLAEQLAPLIVAAMPRESAPDKWMSTREAAEYAGCSVHSLRRAMAARELRFSQDADRAKAWHRRAWLDEWRGL